MADTEAWTEGETEAETETEEWAEKEPGTACVRSVVGDSIRDISGEDNPFQLRLTISVIRAGSLEDRDGPGRIGEGPVRVAVQSLAQLPLPLCHYLHGGSA
jgi:hypothetical protein